MNRGGRHYRQHEAPDEQEERGCRLFQVAAWKKCTVEQQRVIQGCQEVFDASLTANPAVLFPADNSPPTPARGITPFVLWNMPSVLPGIHPHHEFRVQYKQASQSLWAYASQAHNSIPLLNRTITRLSAVLQAAEEEMSGEMIISTKDVASIREDMREVKRNLNMWESPLSHYVSQKETEVEGLQEEALRVPLRLRQLAEPDELP
jgi:hypothetical protein